jgi:hypothetical protein
MPILAMIIVIIVGYFGYQASPIPQCLEISETLDDISNRTVFSMRWSAFDKVACVFSSSEQRATWQTAAISFRFNALQLQQSMNPPLRR